MTAARPWETVPPPPWATAQPLYDRVISIRRPTRPATVGAIGYQGLQPVKESIVLANLPASIQFQPKRERPLGGTPSDATSIAQWHVFIPSGYAIAGQIVERDVVADDLGRRFAVFAAWPTALGFVLAGEMLEA